MEEARQEFLDRFQIHEEGEQSVDDEDAGDDEEWNEDDDFDEEDEETYEEEYEGEDTLDESTQHSAVTW